jgi:cytochrome c553
MRIYRFLTALILLAPLVTRPALAQGKPELARGIVAEHCTACHEVPNFHARHGRASVNAPSFQSIADQPKIYTRTRLEAFLRKPHYPMTKFVLSRSDIDNLVAFIEALRKK